MGLSYMVVETLTMLTACGQNNKKAKALESLTHAACDSPYRQ